MNCTERLMTSLKKYLLCTMPHFSLGWSACIRSASWLSPLYLPLFTFATPDVALTEAHLTDGVCSRNRHAIVGDRSHIKEGKDLQTQADCKRWGLKSPIKRPRLRYFKVQPRKGCGWGTGLCNHKYLVFFKIWQKIWQFHISPPDFLPAP